MAIVPAVDTSMYRKIVGRRSGMVIRQNTWRCVAPSIQAASYISGGTALRPEVINIIAKAMPRQVFTTMIINNGTDCSQFWAGIPKCATIRLTVEYLPPASIDIQMKPATTSGAALGKRIAALKTGLNAIGRLNAIAEASPSTNCPTIDEPKTKKKVTTSEFQNPSSENSRT